MSIALITIDELDTADVLELFAAAQLNIKAQPTNKLIAFVPFVSVNG